jgi:DNA ligase 1
VGVSKVSVIKKVRPADAVTGAAAARTLADDSCQFRPAPGFRPTAATPGPCPIPRELSVYHRCDLAQPATGTRHLVRQNRCVLLSEVVDVSAAVAATPARNAKIEQIAALLARVPPGEVTAAVAFLSGELLQGQIGVGYAAVGEMLQAAGAAGSGPGGGTGARADDASAAAIAGEAGPPPAPGAATLTLTDVDAAFGAIGAVTGPGSQAGRRRLLTELFARATQREREFLVRLLAGDLGQGALEGVMTDAVAKAAGVPAEEVRRAHQLGGSLPEVARAALGGTSRSADRALAALRGFTLRVGRPVRPMLAASAPDIAAALDRISPAATEWKIDGIRIQVHRSGRDVAVFTRTLDDITARVPEITEAAMSLPVADVVLDGEAVALTPDGRPRPFQVTAARTASQGDVGRQRGQTPLTPFLFDLLYLDGADLIDAPASERHRQLSEVAPAALLTPRIVTADPVAAGAFLASAIARGHEGVVLKSLDSPYRAGRRGSDWIKVKPRHTLDLVVLAAEWGHGRRRGVLSNLHLGARDPETGGLVMLGKTFKGLTDEMLAWQTTRLLELTDPARRWPEEEDRREAHGVVWVRPELVVEIAFDGVQASRRYPGGLALRFARVLRFRPDKSPAEADTIDAVRAIWSGQAAP